MPIKQSSLYYKDGSSDKVYHLQIEESGTGFLVNFQYGKRGSTLKAGTKTANPVTQGAADKIYDDILKEKMGKGYSPGESGAVFQSKTFEERFTGIAPQLLNDTEEDTLEALFKDDSWVMQEKHDGHRQMLKMTALEVTGINKKGLSILIPENLESLIKSVKKDIVVDGELIGEKYYIFDVLEYDGKNLKDLPYKERYAVLSSIKELAKNVTPAAFNEKDKRALFEKIKTAELEGVVFKKKDSKYIAGRPASGGSQLKYKFWASATVVVESQHTSKRSVAVMAYDDNKKAVKLGSVTIPANQEIPKVGDLVEVVYLYCFEGGKLYQSKYKGKRIDQALEDCTTKQLKYKPQNADLDDDEAADVASAIDSVDEAIKAVKAPKKAKAVK